MEGKLVRKNQIGCLLLVFAMVVGSVGIFGGSSVRAAQGEPVDWWVESVELTKLSDFPEFDGWSTELLAVDDYEGYCSEDGKSFWLSGIHLSSEDVKKVEVPEKIDGLTVTRVSQFSPNAEEPNLFRECHRKREINDSNNGWLYGQKVEELVLPDSVTEIGQKAFQNMPALKKVVLPARLKKMGSLVFSGDIKDIQKKSRTNYVEPLLKGYKVSVAGKNKTYGFKSGCLYVKKTGELLYYANKNKDPRLPSCIKELTSKTCFISPYINSITLSKNMKTLDCRYIHGGESYLHKITFPSAKAVKIKHADALTHYDAMTLYVPKKLVKKYKKQVRAYKKININISK